jgi:uncharacterized protein (DUF983 family)
MSYHDTQLYSILNNKCPHCHEGNFWKTSNPYDLKNFAKMNERCPVCNEDFRREPGYYFGATYVSYALTVAFGVLLYAILGWYLNMDTIPFLIIFSVFLIILLPFFYRTARLMWINMFVPYKKKK